MDEKQELLEIYKLHAELADSVSKQRSNRKPLLYASFVGFSCAFFCFPTA